jgi:hypothetical protein
MKYRVTFKTNDVLDQVEEEAKANEELDDLKEITRKYIKYGEYITIEFDTVSETVCVVPVNR